MDKIPFLWRYVVDADQSVDCSGATETLMFPESDDSILITN